MRLFFVSTILLVGWHGTVHAGGDTFAAVPGTGWTDISQLQSTCSVPGYFVNPSDCSRFYVCVDHSTPEKSLLLRYDFDCPGGLAFDESTSNCNYPGPSGCVENGGGSSGGGGSGGWGSGNSGWGWSQNPGIFQSTATVQKYPAWGAGTATIGGRQTIINSGQTSGGTIVRVTPAPPVASNPRVNIPTTTIVQIPATHWESQRIHPVSHQVFQSARTSDGQGWSHSSRVTGAAVLQNTVAPSNPTTVTWGSAKIVPVQTNTVYQSSRVTPVPPAQWEVPQSFPVPQTTIVQQPSGGWGARITASTPRPVASNPSVPTVFYATVTASPISFQSTPVAPTPSPAFQAARVTQTSHATSGVIFQSARVSPAPQPQGAWQSVRVTPTPQSQGAWQSIRVTPTPQPQGAWQSIRVTPTPQPQGGWQNVRVTPTPQPTIPVNVVQSGNVASNPSLQIPVPQDGWANVRFTQLPSGYIWQSNPSSSQSENVVLSTPSTPVFAGPTQPTQQAYFQSASTSGGGGGSTVQSSNFGIVQQVINEQQQSQAANGGKSHIQLIYETKERQQTSQAPVVQYQQQTVVQRTNQVQRAQSSDPSNPVYEIVSSQDSLPKGRIIVLFAPYSGGSKREAPIVEVEVEEDDDEGNNNNNN